MEQQEPDGQLSEEPQAFPTAGGGRSEGPGLAGHAPDLWVGPGHEPGTRRSEDRPQ